MRKNRKSVFNFDDSNLPVNDLSPERIVQIEKIVLPLLQEALADLKKEKPHLFKSTSGK